MTFKKIIRVVSATHTRVGHEGWPKKPSNGKEWFGHPVFGNRGGSSYTKFYIYIYIILFLIILMKHIGQVAVVDCFDVCC
jgi:hypothetical protein